MNKPKVAILLSTYNGEKYLEEQLDSLLKQTYSPIEIYIRDDGSKDQTITILEKYQKQNANIYLEKGENIGFIQSFFHLLEWANKADYYAYCDQDDVWLENKIERAVNSLNQLDSTKPCLYFSNSDYYDLNMNFIDHAEKNKVYHFRNALVECVTQGMTMVINQKTRNLIQKNPPQYCTFHDWWTYMICSGFGEIVYDSESLVKYRRHGKSVTAEGKNFLEIFFWRVKKFFVEDSLAIIRKQLREYEHLYGKELSLENQKLLSLFTNEKYYLIKALKKTFYPRRFRRKWIDEISVRILFLIGKL